MTKSGFAVLMLLVPVVASAADAPLGRLFFTPDQRAQLDMLRTKKVAASQTKDEPAPEVVTYNGIIRRSDGKTTVWVNSQALSEADLREKPAIAGRVTRDGQILLQANQSPKTGKTQLKVGQSAELLSGQVAESYSSAAAAARAPKADPAVKPAAPAPAKDVGAATTSRDAAAPDRAAASAPAASSPAAPAAETRP